MRISKMEHISTKTGDSGQSENFVKERFDKDDLLFETLGTMDELSSFLGLSYQIRNYDYLRVIQQRLQDINSLIATNPNHQLYAKLRPISEDDLSVLEKEEQILLDQTNIEPKFLLPGSDTSLSGSYVDVSRAIARKAERRLVHFIKGTKRDDLNNPLKYMNRLSDFLFIYARFLSETEAKK